MKYVYIVLGIIIFALILNNVDIFSKLISTITGLFGNSFKAVTSVGTFAGTAGGQTQQ